MINADFKPAPFKVFDWDRFTLGVDTFTDPQNKRKLFFTKLTNVDFIDGSLTYRGGRALMYTGPGQFNSYGVITGNPNLLMLGRGLTLYYFKDGIASNPTVLTSAILTNNAYRKGIVPSKVMDDWGSSVASGTTTNTTPYSYKLEDSTKTWTVNAYVGKAVDIGSNGNSIVIANTATELFFYPEIPVPVANGASYAVRNLIDGFIVTNPKDSLQVGTPTKYKYDGSAEIAVDTAFFKNDYASIAVPFKDRIFYTGYIGTLSDRDNNILGWSARGFGDLSSTSWFLQVGPAGSKNLEALEINGMLSIFNTSGIFLLKGTDETDFSMRKISDIAPVSAGSIARGSNEIYFMAHDGVRKFTGYEALNLKAEFPFSREIQDVLETMTTQQQSLIRSALYDNKYYVQIGAVRYVLHLRESREFKYAVWTTEETANSGMQSVWNLICFSENATVKDAFILITDAGKVYRDDSTTSSEDDGSAISWVVETMDIDLGQDSVDKYLEKIITLGDTTVASFVLTAAVSYDGGVTYTTIGTSNRNTDNKMWQKMIRGPYKEKFRIKFTASIPTGTTGVKRVGTTNKARIISRMDIFYLLRGLNI